MPGAMQQMPQRSHLQMFNTQQHFNANQQNISIIENATVPVETSSQAISAGENSTKQGVENTSGQQTMSDYQHQQYHQSMLTEQQSYVNVSSQTLYLVVGLNMIRVYMYAGC